MCLKLAACRLVLAGSVLLAGAAPLRAQTYKDFTTPTPLAEGQTLIIGFLGGWEKWNNEHQSVRRLALELREMHLPGVYVETVENHRRPLALQLVKNALDRNKDGKLDPGELRSARVIIYGQSFGGAAVNKLSRELKKLGVPVLLTIQVDSVGRRDALVPSNVRRAVNFYQRDDMFFIRGQREIRAEDPKQTEILGNVRFDYKWRPMDLSNARWYQRLFRNAHVKMEQDPAVWTIVEALIVDELTRE